MKKLYTGEELKKKLSQLGLTQQWLADTIHVSRQAVCAVLNDANWNNYVSDNRKEMYRMLMSYVVDDIDENGLQVDMIFD